MTLELPAMTLELPGFSLDLSALASRFLKSTSVDYDGAQERMRKRFAKDVGFYDLPFDATQVSQVQTVARELRKDFPAALVIGIGGSYLGAASAATAVGNTDFPITWVSNIDPHAIRLAEAQLAARKHAAIVISKSGNTTETLAAFYHFSRTLDPKGWVMITDPQEGELRLLAGKHAWKSLQVPPNIGGRFSVLSPVGLLPATLAGVDIEALLDGARQTRAALDQCKPSQNPAYLLAAGLHAADLAGFGQQYLMPYWGALSLFAQWYVQLWGESLGKLQPDGTRVGPTPVAALGSTDQHSLLQLFKEGPRNKVVGFIDVLTQGKEVPVGAPAFQPGPSGYLCRHSFDRISHEACAATQQSVENSGLPTYRITIPTLDAAVVGALYFFYETATAFAAELYGVNAFDQPGVEEAKRLLRKALS